MTLIHHPLQEIFALALAEQNNPLRTSELKRLLRSSIAADATKVVRYSIRGIRHSYWTLCQNVDDSKSRSVSSQSFMSDRKTGQVYMRVNV